MDVILRGPADPDAFRIKVGRYGDRWYHDPLPACDIAQACTDAWPSATTVKNAWPKFLTNWAAKAAATYAVEHHADWSNLDPKVAIDVISKEHDRIRDRGANRGSAVHHGLEAIAGGKPLDEIVDHEIADWIPAMRQLILDVQPEWVLSEAVAISRTLGYGGTLDAIWRIDGAYYLIDFKSRAAGKVDTCYDEEGVQLGLYGAADYVIVQDGTNAVRRRLPDLAGGLVISIAPEGHRLYPVDLDVAREAATVLRQFWQVQADKGIVGKPVLLRNTGQPTVDPLILERRTWVIACVQQIRDAGHLDDLATIWPPGVPTFKASDTHTSGQLDAIAEACAEIGHRHQLPFFDPDPANRHVPTDDPRVAELIEAAEQLPDDLVAKAGADCDLKALRSGRATTDQIATAAMALTTAAAIYADRRDQLQTWRAEFGDDDLFTALVRIASGQHAPRSLSKFTDADTARLRSLLGGVDAGVVAVAIDNDGTVTVACTTDATTVLLERHGGRKQVLDLAKPAARDLGLNVPRSFADVVANPILTAAVAA